VAESDLIDWTGITGQRLFFACPEPAILVSTAGQVVAGNSLACELFGYGASFPQVSVEDLLTQLERERLQVLDWLQRWAETTDSPELDYIWLNIKTPSGVERRLRIRVSKITEAAPSQGSGRVFYFVTMHDIASLEQRLRDERESHRLATSILNLSADGVLVVNDAGAITYVNPSAAELFGYRSKQMLKMPLADLLPKRFRLHHQEQITRFGSETIASRYMRERTPIVGLTRNGEELRLVAGILKINLASGLHFAVQVRLADNPGA
jgi:PAS domain S-box-containing protein